MMLKRSSCFSRIFSSVIAAPSFDSASPLRYTSSFFSVSVFRYVIGVGYAAAFDFYASIINWHMVFTS